MRGEAVRREAGTDRADQLLWRRSCMVETVEDECALFLDLAAFSEGRLDPDERERVAERLPRPPDAAGDVDAAGALAHAAPQEALSDSAVARACALVGPPLPTRQGAQGRLGSVISFPLRAGPLRAGPMRAGRKPVLGTIAQWSGL